MEKTEKFDFEAFEAEALEKLRRGKPLEGSDGVLGPLLKRLLEATALMGSWMLTLQRKWLQARLTGVMVGRERESVAVLGPWNWSNRGIALGALSRNSSASGSARSGAHWSKKCFRSTVVA